jgi:hypothetical protein
MPRNNQSLTLIELIISLVLMVFIILGFYNIESFCHNNLLVSVRRARIQNDASLVLGHMTKNLLGAVVQGHVTGGAIGDLNQPEPAIALAVIGIDNALKIWVDYNANGKREDSTIDKQVAYAFNLANNEIRYYPNYTDNPAAFEVITQHTIRPDFSNNIAQPTHLTILAPNLLEIQISACWDPNAAAPNDCGSANNPTVRMITRVNLPAVSAN